ncbi:MAG: DUF2461 domain-containing protein [Rhodocyclaceae bacterium]|nr:DUF2461 domain-containing protein [Rhodocyclaceae bacterium]
MACPDPDWPATAARFLTELDAHNTRDWFQANKQRHAHDVADPGKRCLEALRLAFGALRERPVSGRIFRIARDMRFARDAAPYHPWLRMAFHSDGEAPGYYLSIEPAQVRFGVGCLGFDAGQLTAWRTGLIADEGAPLEREIRHLRSDGWRLEPPELKRLPHGFSADLPRADWLRYRQLTLWRDAPPSDFGCREALQAWCLGAATSATGLSDWLANALPTADARRNAP